MLYLLWTGAWPPRALVLCLTNDVLWWAPFGLYLRDAWPTFRASPGLRDRAVPIVTPVSRR